MTTSVWQVSGMTCAHCELSVTEELSELPGVREVTADHATGRVEISSTQPLDRTAVAAAVEEAGYSLP